VSVNRKQQPCIKTIDEINLVEMEKVLTPSKCPMYVVNTGGQDIVRIDLIFKAGTAYAETPLVARIVNAMLTEGTRNFNRYQVAEMLDFYGVHYGLNVEKDHAYLFFIIQKALLNEVIDVIKDVVTNAVFPEEEYATLLNNKKQQFMADSQKVNILAKRHFFKHVFGAEHPYGKMMQVDDFEQLKKEQVVKYYKDYYSSLNCKILATGHIDENTRQILLERFFSASWNSAQEPRTEIECPVKTVPGRHIIKKSGAVQSAIRIGKSLINKTHPDYPCLLLTNVLLGGYFGSRLMKNIREDKGYTYGISSMAISNLHSGYFVIHSEVGRDVCFKAMDEVHKELRKLISEPVDEKELNHVKNYLLGIFLRMVDGPLAIADAYKSLIEYEQDEKYLNSFIRLIKEIKPQDVNKLAEKYLQPESMVEVIAGDH